jgi:hypothetical protein
LSSNDQLAIGRGKGRMGKREREIERERMRRKNGNWLLDAFTLLLPAWPSLFPKNLQTAAFPQ